MARLKADPALEATVTDFRNSIRDLGKNVKALMAPDGLIKTVPAEHRSEGFANVMLAYRHLEDARMRLGKLMQSAQGGESIFDQESVSEPKPQGGA